jgi:hypothetical protein
MLHLPFTLNSQRRRSALALCIAAAMSACGGSGGQGTPSAGTQTPPLPEQAPTLALNSLTAVVSNLTCVPDEHIASPQGTTLFNNTWNSAAAGAQTWQQCLQSRTWAGSTTSQFGWRWSWPDAGGALFAYPSVIVGAKPWEAGPGNDVRFPLRLADAKALSLRFAAETNTSATHSLNLAASVWLISTPKVAAPPDETAIQAEVMVWTDYTDDMVADPGTTTLQGEFTDAQGIRWNIFADKNWGDASSSTGHRWTYVAFHIQPGQRRTAAQIDLLAMLKHASGLGLFSDKLYIADVELGNEIVAGQGETWLTDFAVTAN